jgi:nitroreductase
MSHPFADLVKNARSYRRYIAADPIPAELVEKMVDLVRLVPSAANQQPLRYRIVTNPEQCAQVFTHTKWAAALKTWAGPTPAERPTAYIAILTPLEKPALLDVGIAAQTLQLAATAHGYGACMLGAIDRPGIKQALALPPSHEIQLLIALGRPGEKIVLEDLPADGSTAYWRTPDEVHHVPKRSLKDVMI